MARSLSFVSAAQTHVGMVRALNEDAMVDRPAIGLWAVADGMGGHEAGEVASGLVAEALNHVETLSSGYAFLDEVRASLLRANHTLVARAASLSPGSIMGSTVVALLVYGGHYACLWAGDSRAYMLRDMELKRLSRDHSVVQELIDAGNLTPAEAKSYRRSNVITRAVGVQEDFSLDIVEGAIEAGDIFLLCSDGLTGMVADEEIAAILKMRPTSTVAEDLIRLTLERGAKDNVTVIVIRADASPDDTLGGDGTLVGPRDDWSW